MQWYIYIYIWNEEQHHNKRQTGQRNNSLTIYGNSKSILFICKNCRYCVTILCLHVCVSVLASRLGILNEIIIETIKKKRIPLFVCRIFREKKPNRPHKYDECWTRKRCYFSFLFLLSFISLHWQNDNNEV